MKLSRDYLIGALALVIIYLLFMNPRKSFASGCVAGKACMTSSDCGGKQCIKSFWTGATTCRC